MALQFTYDPKQVSMIVGGKIMAGFADGTYIEAERDEDSFMKKIGVDGEVSRAKNNNRGGKITITLMQTSPSNDDLSAFQQADEQTGQGVVPVILKDGSGRTLITSTAAWVKKPAKVNLAKEVETRQWILDVGEFIVFVGGN